jgi:glycosyltransferase involved in cell wall biosynthesis
MAAVTIGVPVFNEAARLERCLDVLRAQTFTDFEVLIFDNASTDATRDIAQSFCARDSRFHYLQQPVNKGALANFKGVLDAAQSPYFMWRAADDKADLDYLEALHGLLESDSSKHLAVGRIVGTFRGEVERTTPFPDLKGDGGLSDQWRLMFRSSASWVYGLYRRDIVVPIMDTIVREYGDDTWAWDFLLMLPFFVEATVAGTNATSFEAALRPRRGEPGQPRPPKTKPDLDERLALRRRFLSIAKAFVEERVAPGPGRTVWAGLLWLYADRRVYNTKQIVRRSARRLVGLKP